MALQVDSQDQVQEVLAILSRRRWLILLPAAYVITIGVVLSIFAPKRYVAEMEINLLEARVDNRSYGSDSLQESATLREIENAEFQVRQFLRVRSVIEELNWVDFLQLDRTEQRDYLERVRDRIEVDVADKSKEEGSTFVNLSYSDVDRDRAEEFLSRLAILWVTEVYERDANNLREERDTFRKLRDEAKRELEGLERERRQLITDNDLTPAQVDGNARGSAEDPVSQALIDRKLKLEELETEISKLAAGIEAQRNRIDTMPKEIVATETAQGGYDKEIQLAVDRIAQLKAQQDKFTQRNTNWLRIQDEIALLERGIDQLREAAKQVRFTATPTPNEERQEQVAQLETKKIKQAELLAERDRLAALNDRDERDLDSRIAALSRIRQLDTDIEAAQANYAAASASYFNGEQSLRVLQQAYGQPWLVTKPSESGKVPTEPNTAILVVVAIVLGLGLGVALAVAAEFLRGGMRTAGDAARAIDLPVLGVVGEFKSRAERRALLMRNAVLSFSTLLIIGSAGWFTWTWAKRPELLSSGILEAIENVRREFR